MPASTAPEAKKRILDLIAARANIAGANIVPRWAPPGENEDMPQGGEMVYLGDVELDGFWQVLGAARRNEEYTIQLFVFVQQFGDDPQTTEERSWEILDEVSAALNSDKSLGGLLHAAGVEIESAAQSVGAVGPSQTGSRIDAVIRCQAQFIP